MEHWLTALIAPLFELNPIKYIYDEKYRKFVGVKLGRRAGRIFRYQIFALFVAALASIMFIVAT